MASVADNQGLDVHLQRLRYYPGLWHNLEINKDALGLFTDLLEYVPAELERALNQVANFWEDLASCVDCIDDIRNDDVTADQIEALWPACSSLDTRKLRVRMDLTTADRIFPLVTSVYERDIIQQKIEKLRYRVPSLRLVVREAGSIQQMIKWLKEAFGEKMTFTKITGEKISLNRSALEVNGEAKGTVNDVEYYMYFLAAARACSHKDIWILRQEIGNIFNHYPPHNRLNGSRGEIVAGNAVDQEFWKVNDQAAIIDCLHVSVFQSIDRTGSCKAKPKHLSMPCLLRDFFSHFFGDVLRLPRMEPLSQPAGGSSESPDSVPSIAECADYLPPLSTMVQSIGQGESSAQRRGALYQATIIDGRRIHSFRVSPEKSRSRRSSTSCESTTTLECLQSGDCRPKSLNLNLTQQCSPSLGYQHGELGAIREKSRPAILLEHPGICAANCGTSSTPGSFQSNDLWFSIQESYHSHNLANDHLKGSINGGESGSIPIVYQVEDPALSLKACRGSITDDPGKSTTHNVKPILAPQHINPSNNLCMGLTCSSLFSENATRKAWTKPSSTYPGLGSVFLGNDCIGMTYSADANPHKERLLL